MSNIGIFYGSTGGNTQDAAKELAKLLDADVHNVYKASVDELNNYETIILGSSTWGVGELQDDWEDFLPKLQCLKLEGKKVALFGLGDGESYADTFVDAIGIIHNALKGQACQFIGKVSTDGYEYDESLAEIDGMFVGLPLDDDNQSDLSTQRLIQWAEQLKTELQ